MGYQVEMVQQAVCNLGGGFETEMTTLVSVVFRPEEVQGVKSYLGEISFNVLQNTKSTKNKILGKERMSTFKKGAGAREETGGFLHF